MASAQFPRLDFGYVFKKPMNNSCVKIQVARFFAVGKTVKKKLVSVRANWVRLGFFFYGELAHGKKSWSPKFRSAFFLYPKPYFYSFNGFVNVVSYVYLVFVAESYTFVGD